MYLAIQGTHQFSSKAETQNSAFYAENFHLDIELLWKLIGPNFLNLTW